MPRPNNPSRDLLVGLLALQNGLIHQFQLVAAFQAWTFDKTRALADHLILLGHLSDAQRSVVEAMADLHVAKHGDVERSLAAIPADRCTHESLSQLGDADIAGSLAHFRPQSTQPDGEADAERTAAYSVGSATSDSLRFRVLRPHARGGLGAVFVAMDTELHREVALKQILDQRADDPESRTRFVREAEITGGLEHPGIVPVYGLGTYADGRPFYAMRFIRGNSLKDAIDGFHVDLAMKSDHGRRSLELRKLLRRFTDVCNAIDYAHNRGILHRDIKPANVILGKHGETLVVDWGLAKPVGRAEPRPDGAERTLVPSSSGDGADTLPGSAIGTPAYMSPEQAAGELDRLGPQSDVYSLGGTLYCLLTGKQPFEGSDIGDILRKVRDGAFARPRQLNSSIDKALEAVCLKAMARKPQDRYSSPKALADDLERWLADEPVTAWSEPLVDRGLRWVRRHRSGVITCAAAIGIGLVALATIAAVEARSNKDLRDANERVSHERNLAQQNFAMARQAVDDYLSRVGQNPLLREQGLHELRQDLLEAALQYYDDFLRQRGNDPALRAEAAAAYERVGDIHRELGNFSKAVSAYDQGVALASATANGDGVSAVVLRTQGSKIAALTSLGRHSEAIDAFVRTSGLWKPDEWHNGGEIRPLLVKLYNAGAEAYRMAGNPAESLQAAQRALEVGENVADDHPGDVESFRDLLVAYTMVTRLLFLGSRIDEALQVGERGLKRAEAMVGDHPRDIDLRLGLCELLEQLSNLALPHGRKAQALEYAGRSVSHGDALTRQHPLLFRPRHDLIVSLSFLSNIQSDLSQPVDALRSAELAIENAEILVRRSSDSPVARVVLAYGLAARGKALRKTGDATRAIESLRRAAEILKTSDETMYLYNAACCLSMASSIDDPSEKGSPADRLARRTRDADQAVELLKKAIDHGLSEAALPKSEPDLEPINQREDFKQLIRLLEAKPRATGVK
jgi:eukaryotic-like serine/threonine-protein kinase